MWWDIYLPTFCGNKIFAALFYARNLSSSVVSVIDAYVESHITPHYKIVLQKKESVFSALFFKKFLLLRPNSFVASFKYQTG